MILEIQKTGVGPSLAKQREARLGYNERDGVNGNYSSQC